jgi:hypothetical protein
VPNLLRMRTLITKFVGTVCAVSAGLPMGPEGPMVHIGACVASVTTYAKLCEPARRWLPGGAACALHEPAVWRWLRRCCPGRRQGLRRQWTPACWYSLLLPLLLTWLLGDEALPGPGPLGISLHWAGRLTATLRPALQPS